MESIVQYWVQETPDKIGTYVKVGTCKKPLNNITLLTDGKMITVLYLLIVLLKFVDCLID